jgi:hypothetical protein
METQMELRHLRYFVASWRRESRPLKGESPTIDLALAYNANDSPILKLLLSKLGDLKAHAAPRVEGYLPGICDASPD